MKADTVSDARLEAGKRWVQGVFEHVRDRDAQTRQLFASHCVVCIVLWCLNSPKFALSWGLEQNGFWSESWS